MVGTVDGSPLPEGLPDACIVAAGPGLFGGLHDLVAAATAAA